MTMRPPLALFLCLLLNVSMAFAQKKKPPAETPLTPAEKAAHILDRFAFGPRPGDLQAVEKQGPERWFETQLQPDSIPDRDLDARLAPLRSLRMSASDLVVNFPTNQMLQQVDQGKQPMPSDPQLAAIYSTL
ncbi:MAG: DUF1800 family protein, partial [Acidobacteriales bacterium]|nr:DUF1800 family protein [Terriglobales bacterium]